MGFKEVSGFYCYICLGVFTDSTKMLSQNICYPGWYLYWAPCKHRLETLQLHRPAQFPNALGFVAMPVVNILLIEFFWRCPGFNRLSWVHGSCCPASVCIPAVWAWTPRSIRLKCRKEIVNGICNDHIVVCWHYKWNDNTGQTSTCKLKNENVIRIKQYWVRICEQFSHIKASYVFLCVFSTVSIFTKDSE